LKILGSVIGVLLALGVLFMLVGVSLGAKTGIYWDASGIHSESGKDTKQRNFSELNLEPFVDIDLKMINCDIEFVDSNRYGFELTNNSNTDITWSLQNGKLSITEKARSRWWSLDLGFMRNALKNTSYAKIYLPANALLENVCIKNVNGKVTVSELSCALVDINIISGRTWINNVAASKLVFDGVSGGVTMQNCRFDSARINTISGDNFISGYKTGNLSLSSISGRIDVGGELLGNCEINIVSGDVRLQIRGNSRDYGKQFNLISGNLRIDGKSYSKNYSDNIDGPNKLKVTSTSGNVAVYFVQ